MKAKAKTKASAAKGHPCFECGIGTLVSVLEPFTTRTADGMEITVPDVSMERCTHCGDTVLSAAAAAIVDTWLERATARLSRDELQAFLDQYQLTQREAEQVLGLGEKMISRWLKGPARISASMSNYIRLLMADPRAFDILRQRRWGSATIQRSA